MTRLTKTLLTLLLHAGLVVGSFGFSPIGPFKGWQVRALGYALPGDIGGPMTPPEAYRWNVPVITYACDQRFIAYFGKDGVAAIDAAMKVFNDLPKMSQITNDGSSLYINGEPVPTDSKGPPNFGLNVAGLLDLKSHAMGMVIEELGLAEPERYVWTLRGRDVFTAGGQTFTNYSVIKNNYDPITLQESSYVNGVVYGYSVVEPIAPPPEYAEAIETIRGLPAPYAYSAVASKVIGAGEYYLGLTQDDVGGLRMIYNPNAFANESLLGGITGGSGGSFRSAGGSPWRPYSGILTNLSVTNIIVITNLAGSQSNLVVQGLRPGINQLTLKRANYDSLLGQFFRPVTTTYTDMVISNGTSMFQSVQRVATQPDIVFTVTDLGLVFEVPVITRRSSTAQWQDNSAINGVPIGVGGITGPGGPGVITPQVQILFTDKLPYYLNGSPDFLDGDDSFLGSGTWGSFDENTEIPIIYPHFLDLTLDELRGRALGQ